MILFKIFIVGLVVGIITAKVREKVIYKRVNTMSGRNVFMRRKFK